MLFQVAESADNLNRGRKSGGFDTETLKMKEPGMFVEGYKAVLVKDTSFKGLWKVSFTLMEFRRNNRCFLAEYPI